MSIIVALILGAIVGWLGARIAGREEGLFACIVIGILGAIIGNSIAKWIGAGSGYLTLSWSSFAWSLIGAVILSAILNIIQRPSHTHHRI